jgi:L-aspartate oxidase
MGAAAIAEFDLMDLEKIEDLRSQLPRVVWQGAGISRDQEMLTSAIAQVQVWQQEFQALSLTQLLTQLNPSETLKFEHSEIDQGLRAWGELHNLLDIADLILRSALFRTESRGGHYRSDYPETSTDWEVHTIVQGQLWKTAPVTF